MGMSKSSVDVIERVETSSWMIGQILDSDDVVSFVESIHREELDYAEGDIVDRIFEFTLYKIRYIKIDDLKKGKHKLNKKTIDKFVELPYETLPPIVVGQNIGGVYDVIDGNYRVEAAKRKGLRRIKALFPLELVDVEIDEV